MPVASAPRRALSPPSRGDVSAPGVEEPTAGALEAVAAGPARGPPGQHFARFHLRELSVLRDLVLPVVLLVVGLNEFRRGRGWLSDQALDNDDVGAAVQVDGDRTLFAVGAQDGGAADAELQPLLTPDPPHRSRMGMTRGPRDHPVGPGTGELLVDPRPRQGCPPRSRRRTGEGSARAVSHATG